MTPLICSFLFVVCISGFSKPLLGITFILSCLDLVQCKSYVRAVGATIRKPTNSGPTDGIFSSCDKQQKLFIKKCKINKLHHVSKHSSNISSLSSSIFAAVPTRSLPGFSTLFIHYLCSTLGGVMSIPSIKVTFFLLL